MNFDTMSEAELDAYLAANEPKKAATNFDTISEAELDAYLAANETQAQAPQEAVLNEQYAPIQGTDRALIKNLGGDKEGTMNYLHKEHPKSEFKYSEKGEVLGRDRGSNEWRKMDVDTSLLSPSTWELQDITDVGTDIVGGIAEGAAALGAGAAGMAASPVGALVAGSTAAGATATGIDLVKQGAAKALGLRAEGVSGIDALKEGAFSAATTPLFGFGGGKLVKKVKSLGLDGIEEQAALKVARRLEEGLLYEGIKKAGRGIKETGLSIGALTSSVSKDTYKTLFKNWDTIENMTDADLHDVAKGLQENLIQGVGKAKKEVSAMYDAIKGTGQNIEVGDTVRKFAAKKEELLEAARKSYRGTPENFNVVKNELDNFEAEVFGSLAGRNDIDLENAMNIEQAVKDFFLDPKRAKTTMETGNAKRINDLVKIVSEGMTSNIDSSLKGTKYSAIKKKWKDASDLQDVVSKLSKDEYAMLGNLLSIDTKAGIKKAKVEHLKKITESFDIPFEDTAKVLRAWVLLKDPKLLSMTGAGVTTSRAVLGGAAGFMFGGPMAASLGATVGTVLGSPATVKGIGRVGRKVGLGVEALEQKMKSDTLGRAGSRALWNSIQNRD